MFRAISLAIMSLLPFMYYGSSLIRNLPHDVFIWRLFVLLIIYVTISMGVANNSNASKKKMFWDIISLTLAIVFITVVCCLWWFYSKNVLGVYKCYPSYRCILNYYVDHLYCILILLTAVVDTIISLKKAMK